MEADYLNWLLLDRKDEMLKLMQERCLLLDNAVQEQNHLPITVDDHKKS